MAAGEQRVSAFERKARILECRTQCGSAKAMLYLLLEWLIPLGAKSAVARNCGLTLLKRVEAAIPPTLAAVIRAPRRRMRSDRGKRERSEDHPYH